MQRTMHLYMFLLQVEDKNVETKRCNEEKNKTSNPKINYVYASIFM